jgi:hypothetical protein
MAFGNNTDGYELQPVTVYPNAENKPQNPNQKYKVMLLVASLLITLYQLLKK